MTEKIRKIGLEEMAQETALRAVYGLLRDIEGNICMIANHVAQNPDLWNRTARYFREALSFIFSTQNFRYLAFYGCSDCDRKRCDSCAPKLIISKKFEIFKL